MFSTTTAVCPVPHSFAKELRMASARWFANSNCFATRARSKTPHVLVSPGKVISSMYVSKTWSFVRMRKDLFNILVA